LNGLPGVEEATRRRVLAGAKKLGYQPNVLARALRKEATQLVGLVVPDVRSEFFALATAVLQPELEERGFRIILGVSHDDPEIDREYLMMLVQYRAAGIIHVPCTPTGAEFLRDFVGAPPVIELNRRSRGKHADSVTPTDRDGCAAVTRHLIELGHERIATIAGRRGASTTRERIGGYNQAMNEAGLGDMRCVIDGEYSVEWAYAEITELLTRQRPSAIFASSTQLTAGTMRAVTEAGLHVPRDISIAGYDDPPWYSATRPSITTYVDPLEDMAQMAVQLLLDRIGGTSNGARPVHRRLEGELVLRDSTASPSPSPTLRPKPTR
jgi:LacI family transcriptional regulator